MSSFFQFSIRNLLIAVALIAVGITALFNANIWWEAGLWAIVSFCWALAVLLVIYCRGAQRAFWIGFLVFGSFYFGGFLWSQLMPNHIVSRLAGLAYSTLLPESRRSPFLSDPNDPAGPVPAPPAYASPYPGGPSYVPYGRPSTPGNPSYVPFENFVQVSHALCMLIAALLGGKAAQFICRTRPPAPAGS